MNPSLGAPERTGTDEQALGVLVEELTARLQAGEPVDVQAFILGHPEHAAQLRQLLPALHVLADLGHPADGDATAAGRPTVAAADVVGTLGDFRILREIGRGGMGVVYEAVQISLGRRVALKVLPFAGALDSKQLQRFKNEAQAAAGLHHTNIVPVYFVGCERGVHFYAMQFIDGQTLAAMIAELRRHEGLEKTDQTGASGPAAALAAALASGRLAPLNRPSTGDQPTGPYAALPRLIGLPAADTTPQPQAVSTDSSARNPAYFCTAAHLGVQAAEALEHAHQLAVIHRDIKPANLLVETSSPLSPPGRGVGDEGFRLWVTDFGLAQVQGDAGLTMTGDLLGTIRYMSPEQALAKRVAVDHRTDIYSLGVTLYELLTLEPAFGGSDRHELLRQIAFEEPRPPRRVNRAIPAELETIVLKAMEKNPADRYATAQELADDLRRFLDDKPIRARRPTLRHRVSKWAKRHRGVVWTAVGLLAVLALGSAVSTVLIAQQLRRAEQAETDATARLARAVRAEEEGNKNLEAARQAERHRTEELGKAKLALAEAGRWSGRAGRLFDSLQALAEAARIARSLRAPPEHMLKLRNEAIACMALPDIRLIKEWERYTPDIAGAALDTRLQRYTRSDAQGNISIRGMADDREIMRLNGPGVGVGSVAFSPDGEFLEAVYPLDAQSRRGRILIWDLRRGEIAFRLAPEFPRPAVVWSPDSRRFALHGETRTIVLYDVLSRKEMRRVSTGVRRTFPPVLGASDHEIVFHPDGKQLAVLAWGTVQIRDVETGNLVGQFDFPIPVVRFAWGGAGRFLAGACADDEIVDVPEKTRDIYVWDVPAGRMHKVLQGHNNVVLDVAFNHRGDLLASTAWDGTVRLWNPWTGKELVRTEIGWGQPLQFSPDDRFLSMARRWSRARLWWEVKAVREYRALHGPTGMTGGVGPVDFSPDGRLLASVAHDRLRLWDVAAGNDIALLSPCPHNSFCFEPNGKSLLAGGPSGLHRWPFSLDQDELGRKLRIGPPAKLAVANLSAEDVSRDGRTAVASSERSLVFLDLERASVRKVWARDRWNMSGCRLSPDGKWLASGSWHGGGPKVWDARSGKLVRHLTNDPESHVCFSPDGKWLVTGSWTAYQFWQVGSWKPGLKLARPTASRLMAFSPDGTLLAITHSIWDIELVNPATGRQVATLASPEVHWGASLSFSSDGTQLAVGNGESPMIHIFDLRAIRRHLAAIALDWDLPPYPPPTTEDSRPVEVQLDLGRLMDREKYTLVIAFFPFHAEAYYRRGLALLDAGDQQRALADLDMAILLQPDHAEARYQRGLMHGRAGRFPEASADFSRTIALRPDHAAAYAGRAYVHLQLQQCKQAVADYSKAVAMSDWDKAAADLSKAVAEPNLEKVVVAYWLALARLGAGDLAGYRSACAEMLQRFGATDQPDVAAWVAWTLVLAPDAVKDLDHSAKLADAAVRRAPENEFCSNTLGAALYRAGRFGEALRQLNAASAAWQQARDKPATHSRAYAWFFLAMTHQRLGHAIEARQWLDRALKWMEMEVQNPGNKAVVVWNRRLTLQLLRREAQLLITGKADYPAGEQNATAWFLATYADPQVRDPARALKLARRAVAQAPEQESYWLTLGVAHYRGGDWKASIAALDKALALGAGDGAAGFFLAMAHWKLGGKERARQAFSRANEWLAKHAPEDEELRRFHSEAAGLLGEVRLLHSFIGHGMGVHALAFFPDGRRVLSGSFDGTVRLWDTETGKQLRRWLAHSAWVTAVAYAPDGRRVLSGSYDNTARLWEAETGKRLRQFLGHTQPVEAVAFSPDGRRALSGSRDKTMRLWDTDTGKELRRFEGHADVVRSVAFSPDGRRALSGSFDKTLRLWDVKTGRELRRFKGHTHWVVSAVFSPDGKRILSGSRDKTLRLWDVDSGRELRRFEGHTALIECVTFSPDGRRALSGADDATARLWDVDTGRELYRFDGHKEAVCALAFSPDGRRALIAGVDKAFQLWSLPSRGKERLPSGAGAEKVGTK
jgi:WD40 repeat protein/serine/threonine protein kinase/predicted Zn-dependent protease